MRSSGPLARSLVALGVALGVSAPLGGCSDEGKKDGVVLKTDEKQQKKVQDSMKDFIATKGKAKAK